MQQQHRWQQHPHATATGRSPRQNSWQQLYLNTIICSLQAVAAAVAPSVAAAAAAASVDVAASLTHKFACATNLLPLRLLLPCADVVI